MFILLILAIYHIKITKKKFLNYIGNGTFVIGQEQDRIGGGFSELESFLGKLTLLDIWSTVLAAKDIKHLLNTCKKYHGDIIAWAQVQQHIHGDVTVIIFIFFLKINALYFNQNSMINFIFFLIFLDIKQSILSWLSFTSCTV